MSNDPAYNRMLLVIEQKTQRGERLTREERAAVWFDKVKALDAEIAPLLKGGEVRAAIKKVLLQLAARNVAELEHRDRLEDRIAALEAAAKPRQRVKAPTERIP